MYCGTDIIEVNRIKEAIENSLEFKSKIFTENEIKDIDKIKSDVKYQRYAGRFAAKEAIYKAMSKILCSKNIHISFKEIEINNKDDMLRRPYVKILNIDALNIFKEYNIDVSISHIKETAIAMCVISDAGEKC